MSTADRDYYFSPFLNKAEAFSLIQQLANLAMRRLMEGNETGYQQDLDLLIKRSRNVPKKASFLKRDLDAKKASEEFRIVFQVPNTEKLDGQVRTIVFFFPNRPTTCHIGRKLYHTFARMLYRWNATCGRRTRSAIATAASASARTSPASIATSRVWSVSSSPCDRWRSWRRTKIRPSPTQWTRPSA